MQLHQAQLMEQINAKKVPTRILLLRKLLLLTATVLILGVLLLTKPTILPSDDQARDNSAMSETERRLNGALLSKVSKDPAFVQKIADRLKGVRPSTSGI